MFEVTVIERPRGGRGLAGPAFADEPVDTVCARVFEHHDAKGEAGRERRDVVAVQPGTPTAAKADHDTMED